MTPAEDGGPGGMDRIEQLPVSDWTDQDLLTKDEARERLVAEIGRCRTRLDELKATDSDESEMRLLTRRLAAMESIADEYNDYLDGK
ncbi:hypothetical protein [Mycolicibacter kumamotonensis]